jgi:hypothetical protein
MTNKEKFEELLGTLKTKTIRQKYFVFEANLSNDILNKYFTSKKRSVMCTNLDIRRHGKSNEWYETSIMVIKIHDNFLGIRLITETSNDGQAENLEKYNHTLEFFAMEEIILTSYRIKYLGD